MTQNYFTNKEFHLKKSQDRHQYHTLRYDFKPQSVNSDEPAAVELTQKGEVTIKAPNINGSSSKYTVFKGQRRPHVKECLLVIDNRTGEMVLQKLTDNITVKATRAIGGGAVGSNGSNGGGTGGNGGGGGGSAVAGANSLTAHNAITNNNNHLHQVSNSNGTATGMISSYGTTNGSSSLGPPSVHSTISTNSNISTTSSSGFSSSGYGGSSRSSSNNHRHNNNSNNNNNHVSNPSANNRTSNTKSNNDGPQLSEESSSSSDDDDDDDDSSDSSSSSSSSSDDSQSGNSSPSNDEGFTF